MPLSGLNILAHGEATVEVRSLQRSRVVLVVDDDPAIRLMLWRMLRLQGFSPELTMTVANAIRIAQQKPLGAIILDLTLVGSESGLDFLIWLRAQPKHIDTPVLILTGQGVLREEDAVIIRLQRAHMFPKPLSMSTLTEYLTRVAGSGANSTEGV